MYLYSRTKQLWGFPAHLLLSDIPLCVLHQWNLNCKHLGEKGVIHRLHGFLSSMIFLFLRFCFKVCNTASHVHEKHFFLSSQWVKQPLWPHLICVCQTAFLNRLSGPDLCPQIDHLYYMFIYFKLRSLFSCLFPLFVASFLPLFL